MVTIDLEEKECSKCHTLGWIYKNGLCMGCYNIKLSNN